MSYFSHSRTNMLPFVPHQATRILEAGCGVGLFGELVKKRQDCEYWGVEPHEEAAQEAATRLDRVLMNTFRKLPDIPENYFDCVVFNDVLEHMEDPWGALKITDSYLNNNGIVIASIPNFLYWNNVKEVFFRREWNYKDAGILDKTHLRFFTKKSLIRFFHQCNYEIVQLEGINPYKGRVFNFSNKILFNLLSDYKYLQHAIVARPNK